MDTEVCGFGATNNQQSAPGVVVGKLACSIGGMGRIFLSPFMIQIRIVTLLTNYQINFSDQAVLCFRELMAMITYRFVR